MIDAHFHIWQLDRGDYGWLTPDLKTIYRNVMPADWQAESAPHGITGGVLVQAAPTQAETHFLLAQAEANPAVLGVVGWADLLAPDAPARLATLAQHPKLKALRPMLQDIANPDWVLQDALTPAFAAMAQLGLVLDVLAKPVHLPRVLSLAARHPTLQMVIDHGAKPDIAAAGWEPWAGLMTRIAKETTAVCKLSGLLTEAGPAPAPQVARRWAEHVLSAFGKGRVIWGSDWPVLELASTYALWFEEAQAVADALSPAGHAALFGGTARRIYKL